MNKKKIGTILILFGVGMPIVLGFFQEDGELLRCKTREETIKRKLTKKELNILENHREWYTDQNLWSLKFDLFGTEVEKRKEFMEDLTNYFNSIFTQANPTIKEANKSAQWKITIHKALIHIKFRYFVGLGIALIFVGIGTLLFSFYEKRERKK